MPTGVLGSSQTCRLERPAAVPRFSQILDVAGHVLCSQHFVNQHQARDDRANGHPPRHEDNPGMHITTSVETQKVGIVRDEDTPTLMGECQLPCVFRSQHAGFSTCESVYPTETQPLCHCVRHVFVQIESNNFS
jgi:hypothetical protein